MNIWRTIAELAGRFLREGRVASQLRHPNALEIVDVGEHSGMAYLVVELLEGGTLHDRLATKRILELDDALAIVLPIAAALAHAHAHGVIHRDIKPGNVFLARGADGVTVPKLIDFGLSKSVDAKDAGPLTATGVVMGTVAYMAPEQTMGMKLTTAKSDQYALAAILYECVTGRPPFSAAGFYELLEVVRSGVAPPPSLVNAHLESEIDGPIMRALHRDPAKRFADVRAFAAALLPFASAGVADLWRRELGPRTAAASSANIRAARSPWFDRVLRGDSGRPPPMAPREERRRLGDFPSGIRRAPGRCDRAPAGRAARRTTAHSGLEGRGDDRAVPDGRKRPAPAGPQHAHLLGDRRAP